MREHEEFSEGGSEASQPEADEAQTEPGWNRFAFLSLDRSFLISLPSPLHVI